MLQRVERGYSGLQGVTKSHKGYTVLQGVKGLQGVRGGYKGYREVTDGYEG